MKQNRAGIVFNLLIFDRKNEMETQEPAGYLAIWSDVDPEHRTPFVKWHNCEHLTDRVTLPGFLVGRRYQGVAGASTFLMCYETINAEVLASDPYLRSLNNPTPWAKETIPLLKNTARGIYRLLAFSGKRALTEAPFIFMQRFNISPECEKEVVRWYREEHLPRITEMKGVYRGRLYEMDPEVSNLKTAERKIHGGGPSQQKFLAFYELAAEDLPDQKAWQEVYGRDALSREMLAKMQDSKPEKYWLDFVMYSPHR